MTLRFAAEYAANLTRPSLPARSHIDYTAVTPAPHVRKYQTGDLQHADQVHLNDPMPIAWLVLVERVQLAKIPRVVDENIDAEFVLNDLVDCLRDLFCVRYVNFG